MKGEAKTGRGGVQTHSEVTRDVGPCQDPSGCWEKDGKHREEGLLSEVWTQVLQEDGR